MTHHRSVRVSAWFIAVFAALSFATTAQADETVPEANESQSLQERFDYYLKTVNDAVYSTLFIDVSFGAFQVQAEDEQTKQPLVDEKGDPVMTGPQLPFMVVFLALGAIFYTFWHGFINIRGFKHAVRIVCGKYSSNEETGDIPPFRALTSALSATVGLGNIASVAVAVNTGGPGAIFWMMVLGLFGMTAKFHESTLAQMYRIKNEDGSISGGPMYYLGQGWGRVHCGLRIPGKVLAVVFAVFCMFAALGGGNMFQSNQALEGFHAAFIATPSLGEIEKGKMSVDELRPLLTEKQLTAARDYDRLGDMPLEEVRATLSEARVRNIVSPAQVETLLDQDAVKKDREERQTLQGRVGIGFGLTMAALVAVVVVGGITRIGAATSRIVPAMCLIYVFGCLTVIVFNIHQVPGHLAEVFREAFNWDSVWGGTLGVLIIGFQRAAFSSEAGLGSSAIAHSAARTDEPVREGLVASLEPFIDTIIICFMTAMVVLITDAYKAPQFADSPSGSAITLFAFSQTRLGAWFPYVLTVSIILFAFSTMISWCYYGERAYGYLFGLRTVIVFRLVFVVCVFIGAVASLKQVIRFADAMLLSMALPNIIGGIILANVVRKRARDYWRRYRAGEMEPSSTVPNSSPR